MARDAASVEVCAFDMFGTLFDVHSVVAACRDAFGNEGEAFDALWRRKQLQYSWLRGLMGRYVPFSRVTRDALDTALSVFGRSKDEELRERLMSAYGEVSPYPDARPALEGLMDAGVRRVILTNGSRDMVSSTLAAAVSFGLQGAWVDRPGSEHHLEKLGHDPDHAVEGLTGLVDLLAPATGE